MSARCYEQELGKGKKYLAESLLPSGPFLELDRYTTSSSFQLP